MLRLSKDATVDALKDALEKKTGVLPSNVSGTTVNVFIVLHVHVVHVWLIYL